MMVGRPKHRAEDAKHERRPFLWGLKSMYFITSPMYESSARLSFSSFPYRVLQVSVAHLIQSGERPKGILHISGNTIDSLNFLFIESLVI
jgi:hypothetical protein